MTGSNRKGTITRVTVNLYRFTSLRLGTHSYRRLSLSLNQHLRMN